MRLPGKGSVFALLACALVLVLAGAAAAKRIVGTGGTNIINGTAARDDVFARGGNDVVWGRAGNDFLYGQRGADILQGDVGHDQMWGDALEDTLDGGPGNDRLHGGWGPDVIDGGDGNDILYAPENDGQVDSVDCGPGKDTAIVSRKDQVFGCETVRRVNIRGRIPAGTVVTTKRLAGRQLERVLRQHNPAPGRRAGRETTSSTDRPGATSSGATRATTR